MTQVLERSELSTAEMQADEADPIMALGNVTIRTSVLAAILALPPTWESKNTVGLIDQEDGTVVPHIDLGGWIALHTIDASALPPTKGTYAPIDPPYTGLPGDLAGQYIGASEGL
jgi:hypothetical protein